MTAILCLICLAIGIEIGKRQRKETDLRPAAWRCTIAQNRNGEDSGKTWHRRDNWIKA